MLKFVLMTLSGLAVVLLGGLLAFDVQRAGFHKGHVLTSWCTVIFGLYFAVAMVVTRLPQHSRHAYILGISLSAPLFFLFYKANDFEYPGLVLGGVPAGVLGGLCAVGLITAPKQSEGSS